MELSGHLAIYTFSDRPGKVVLFVMRRGAILELSDELWEAAKSGELQDNELETLTRMGVLVPSRAEERKEMLTIFERNNAKSRCFSALVTLTLDCNLACPYCYEEPFRGKFKMSDETADLLVRTTVERMAAGFDVMLDFYGGEALMALPTLRRIAEPLHREADQRGRKFTFNLVTNGTLLKRQSVLGLVPLGLKGVRVTLDGPKDIHDVQRPFVSGSGSFDTIVSNIKSVCELVQVQIGGNYSRDNYQRYPEMLDQLINEGITPEMIGKVAFNPVIPKSDGSVIGDFSASCSCTSEPWFIEATLFLREEILKRGFDTPKPLPSGCMVEFTNDLVIGYDGAIYKCPAFMGYENLKVGKLGEDISDYAESHNMDVWKTDECLDCAYLPLCFGGCRYLRRLQTGEIDGVDCRKKFLDGVLKEFVRQDLELRG